MEEIKRFIIIGTTECKFRGLEELYVVKVTVPGFYELQDDEGNEIKVPVQTEAELKNAVAEDGTFEDFRIIPFEGEEGE